MTQKMYDLKAEHQPRIDLALERLGSFAGGGAPFTLAFSPSDEALDAAVAAERDWAEGLLYQTMAEYLDQLVHNLLADHPSAGVALAAAAHTRVVRVSIDPENGGLSAPAMNFRDGLFDLVFRAQSLMTSHSGWSYIGHDLPEAIGQTASTELHEDIASDEHLDNHRVGIEQHLTALGDFVGDGQSWHFELAHPPAAMDAAVASEADYMQGKLFETIEQMLGFVSHNVRRDATPELLLQASPLRTIVFEFARIDDLPRRYLGAFQAVVRGSKLHFVGPGGDFKTNGAGASRIGSDIETAVMAARGDTGPTARETALAEALGAIAQTSSKGTNAASTSSGKTCNMCKGRKFNTCNACHGKGGSCNVCRGSGLSRAKCSSCDGLGYK